MRRRIWASLLLGVHVASLLCAQHETIEGFDGATLSLPPFYVEPADGESWTRVTADGFELLTTNDRTFARQFTRSYFEQNHLIAQLVPPRYLWWPYLRDTFIVVDRKNRRLNSDDAMGRIIEQNQSQLTSRFAKRNYLPNLRLVSADNSINFAFLKEGDLGGGGRGGRDRQFFFDESLAVPGSNRLTAGFRFSSNRLKQQLTARAPALPMWLIAGLVDLYDHGEFARGRITIETLEIPKVAPLPSPPESPVLPEPAAAPSVLQLALVDLIIDPIPTQRADQEKWVKHAHLFVRWCLFVDDGKYRTSLWKFVDDSEVHPPSQQRFTETFGITMAEAQLKLEQYAVVAGKKNISFSIARNFTRPDVQVTAAKRSDVSRLLSEWERLETDHVRSRYPELAEL
ncbi:MAG: hypothetical protein HOH58_17750 [Opitutaceae bacterium]|nr:hypothetical protein [Opitutaceae bacterium]